jgi:predicted homoserine dehydrogenase-like protein
MTVRVGVIGTGIMGADHISTLRRQVTGAAVTMVASADATHADLTVAAVRAGKPVMCEKPLLVHCVSRGVASAPGSTSESSVTNSAIHELDAVPWLLDAPVVEDRGTIAVAAGHPSPLASARDGLIASAVADAVIASMRQDGRRAHVELP